MGEFRRNLPGRGKIWTEILYSKWLQQLRLDQPYLLLPSEGVMFFIIYKMSSLIFESVLVQFRFSSGSNPVQFRFIY